MKEKLVPQIQTVETIKPTNAAAITGKARTPRSNCSSLIDEMNSFNESKYLFFQSITKYRFSTGKNSKLTTI